MAEGRWITLKDGRRIKIDTNKYMNAFIKQKVNNTTEYKDYNSDNDLILDDFYDEFEQKYNTLNDDEKDAMKKYCSYHYKDMQKLLLNKETSGEDSTNDLKRWIKNLDKTLDNTQIGKDVVLWRGDNLNHYAKYNPGDTIEFKIYSSCSLNERIASRFCDINKNMDKQPVLVKILAPKETKGFYMGDYATGMGEQEVTLSRKNKYKLVSRGTTKDYYSGNDIEQIILEVIK